MAMQIRWGLVGLGRLAEEHLAGAFAASHNERLVACAGRTADRAREFAATHGVQCSHNSYLELVRDPQVDAVYVATPNHLHHPVVLAAAAAGKHVLCEKPMGLTAAEAEEMVEACRRAGVVLRVGLQSRFQQVLQAAAAVVREGRLGIVREVSVQRYGPMRASRSPWQMDLTTAGSGVLGGLGVHAIDFVHWVVGDRIERVFGLAYPGRGTGQPDESVTLVLEFAGGCQAAIRCGRGLPIGTNDLQAFGTRGMLATGPLRWGPTDRLTVKTVDGTEEREFPRENLYQREIEALAEEVVGTRTAAASGEDGLWLARVTDALIRSFETGVLVPVEG
jgi:1,5-anhydro-D-fructose reductase (1,5-anhydro-D-mannitol-forming)